MRWREKQARVDEEFIAGIYKKAEERKIEEEKTAQSLQNTGRVYHFRAWRTLAAAACLCLIVSGAVYAGSRNADSGENIPAPPGDGAVMALSLDDGGMQAGDVDMAQGSGDGDMRLRERGAVDGGGIDGKGNRASDGEGENARASAMQNAVTDAMYAGFFLAHSQENAGLPRENGANSPVDASLSDIPNTENKTDDFGKENASDILPSKNGTSTPEIGGN